MATSKTKKEDSAAVDVKKVLIVDDHPIVRQALAQLINQQPDMKVCADQDDIESALKAIPVSHPNIAIIDITLGSSSGLKLIEDISLNYPELPVLVLSMHDENLYAERCLRAGAKGYVMKKDPPEYVIAALRKILDGEIYVSETLSTRLLNKLFSGGKDISKSPLDCLSNRELEVYQLIGQGIKTRSIAEKLNLSIKTIETYIDHIKKKMNFKDSRDLLFHAIQWTLGEQKREE